MIASKKDILLDQFATCQNDLSWFPPFQTAVNGLTSTEASWHPNDATHSIWQLVNHLSFWNERWFRRFAFNDFINDEISNEMTFLCCNTEEEWYNSIKRLNSTYTLWRDALSKYEQKLDEPIPNIPEYCWWVAISNLCTHNVYHIGQIVYIRKQQGTWITR